MTTILLATDFDRASQSAFTYCLSIASAVPVRIVVAHVYKAQGEVSLTPTQRDLFREQEMKEYRDSVTRSSRLYPDSTEPTVVQHSQIITEVGEGPVSDKLVDLAGQYGANLIVLGAKKRPGIFKRLFGQISQGLIYQTRIAILIVPENNTAYLPECVGLVEVFPGELESLDKQVKSNELIGELQQQLFTCCSSGAYSTKTTQLDTSNATSVIDTLHGAPIDVVAIRTAVSDRDCTDRKDLIHKLYDRLEKPLFLMKVSPSSGA